jgi:hypothetical protein
LFDNYPSFFSIGEEGGSSLLESVIIWR